MNHTVLRFSEASGLKPNCAKSECFFSNVSEDVIQFTLISTGFQRGSFPIKYLGLPLITTKLKAHDCMNLVQRLCRQIDLWTTRFLRFSGRLQLIKSVLSGIQGFWASYLFLQKRCWGKFNPISQNSFGEANMMLTVSIKWLGLTAACQNWKVVSVLVIFMSVTEQPFFIKSGNFLTPRVLLSGTNGFIVVF